MNHSDIIKNATIHDAIPPFSEQFLRALEEEKTEYQVYHEPGALLIISPQQDAELVVDPAFRRSHKATHLLSSALREHPHLKIWAHGNTPEAQAFAAHHNLIARRTLLVMSRAITQEEKNSPHFPHGYQLRTLAQSIKEYGYDYSLTEFLRVNNEAFDWHPEQGNWDKERLEYALSAHWVNHEGIFLLWKENTLQGFHWTKEEKTENTTEYEVYVLALANSARGQGLSKALTLAGIHYLENRAQHNPNSSITLYVESDNTPALAIYTQLGFSIKEEHVLYAQKEN